MREVFQRAPAPHLQSGARADHTAHLKQDCIFLIIQEHAAATETAAQLDSSVSLVRLVLPHLQSGARADHTAHLKQDSLIRAACVFYSRP